METEVFSRQAKLTAFLSIWPPYRTTMIAKYLRHVEFNLECTARYLQSTIPTPQHYFYLSKKNVYTEYYCKTISQVSNITCPFDFFYQPTFVVPHLEDLPFVSKLRHNTFVTRATNRVCHALTPSIILPSITIPSSGLLPFEAIF